MAGLEELAQQPVRTRGQPVRTRGQSQFEGPCPQDVSPRFDLMGKNAGTEFVFVTRIC